MHQRDDLRNVLRLLNQALRCTFEDMYRSDIRFTLQCGDVHIASADLHLKDRYSFKSLPRPVHLTLAPENPTKVVIQAVVTTNLQHRYVQVRSDASAGELQLSGCPSGRTCCG